jgi:hypothetical protein
MTARRPTRRSRSRARRAALELSAWLVTVEAHEVARWSVEEARLEVYAINDTDARIQATREVHRQAGVPPWKPWMRRTYLRTSATPMAARGQSR